MYVDSEKAKFVHPPWCGCVTILMVYQSIRCCFNLEWLKIQCEKNTYTYNIHIIWTTIAKGEKKKNEHKKQMLRNPKTQNTHTQW